MSIGNSNLNLKKESESIRKLHPTKVPIILSSGKNGPVIKKNKYLVHNELTIGQFIHTVRKKLNIDHTTALFLLIDNKIVVCSKTMEDIYKEFQHEDGFVYGVIVHESTFG